LINESKEKTEFITWGKDVVKWGETIKKNISDGTVKDYREMKTGTIKLGNIVFVFTQGEIFNSYKVQLEKEFPNELLVFMGYTNGEVGYLPDAKAFESNGYEIEQAYIYINESSPLTKDAVDIFYNNIKKLIKETL